MKAIAKIMLYTIALCILFDCFSQIHNPLDLLVQTDFTEFDSSEKDSSEKETELDYYESNADLHQMHLIHKNLIYINEDHVPEVLLKVATPPPKLI
jgi:hypothetical protein